jgi:hypothetical protein
MAGNIALNNLLSGQTLPVNLFIGGKGIFGGPVRVGNLDVAPTGVNGLIYYDVVSNKFLGYANGVWIDLGLTAWSELTGAPVEATDYDYDVSGVKDAVNTVFTTSNNFILNTTKVYLNGVRLTRGADYDYTETSENTITFTEAPHPTDLITIDYLINNTLT